MLTLSDAAHTHLKQIIDDRGGYPKITVNSRGCAGHTYKVIWVAEPEETDEKIILDDLTLLFEPKSTMFILGTHVDYYDGLMGRDFIFENSSQHRCGCGKSFMGSVSEA